MFSEDNVGLVEELGFQPSSELSSTDNNNINIININVVTYLWELVGNVSTNQAYIILWEHIVLREYCTYLLTYSLMIIIDIDIIIPI